MNLFDMIKHDAAQVLRIAADLIFPQDPVETETEEEEFNIDQTVSVGRFTVTLADWPPTLVHELFAFAHEEQHGTRGCYGCPDRACVARQGYG